MATQTHFTNLRGTRRRIELSIGSLPSNPVTGDFFWDSTTNTMRVYDNGQWYHAQFSTTTSTSTSTTSTSSSTSTTTSTSTSTSTTSTSTSTSTTTTI